MDTKQMIIYKGKVKNFEMFMNLLLDKFYGYTVGEFIEEVKRIRGENESKSKNI